MSNTFSQLNETDSLKKVIIGRPQGYLKVPEYFEVHNVKLKDGGPKEVDLVKEFDGFISALTAKGIEVLQPNYVGKFVYDQLTPRDIGVTIGDKFLICNMKMKSRRYEVAGIFPHILKMEGAEPNILIPEEYDACLEGGDIIVDKGFIFLGLSERSNQKGLEYLQKQFGKEFKVVPMQCNTLDEGEDVLHLDCAFNPIGENMALIYKDGFDEIPKEVTDNYTLIEVTQAEQLELATNVLSIDKHTLIARKHSACDRINQKMRDLGLEVIEVEFNGAPAAGGSFRCCSLPLVRG